MTEKWIVVLTTAQLRATEFAVFALVDGAKSGELEKLGYSLAAATRALKVIQQAKRS